MLGIVIQVTCPDPRCGCNYNHVLGKPKGKREGKCMRCGKDLRNALTDEEIAQERAEEQTEERFQDLCVRVEETLEETGGKLPPAMRREIATEMQQIFKFLSQEKKQEVRQFLRQHRLSLPPSPTPQRQAQASTGTLDLLESFVALSVLSGVLSGINPGSSIADIPFQYGYKLPGPTEI